MAVPSLVGNALQVVLVLPSYSHGRRVIASPLVLAMTLPQVKPCSHARRAPLQQWMGSHCLTLGPHHDSTSSQAVESLLG
ncbi:hypothetical protein E2562_039093 [Oryza meyeriana var. granulata]|uniref:Uncharacterized protein n=1 Tax=Oryza meyeriana var. granulata TaxID=110450 RepID=A0A6G1BR21_9ORYZ|nr:hypothetical protein E2562_039093 [Oryza meyeriana var. granulata]